METITQGTDHIIRLTITDASTGAAIDVRTWDLFFSMKKNHTDTEILIEKTEADMTISGTGYNVVDITLTYTETNIDPGQYYFDVKVTNSSGTISLLPPRLLEIVFSITDPETH
ncbi:MAG: hypothetical protein NTV01_00410 [Bacteroidia bacterium]|nr:hypothetical protein [Bacteroidia bacterium]